MDPCCTEVKIQSKVLNMFIIDKREEKQLGTSLVLLLIDKQIMHQDISPNSSNVVILCTKRSMHIRGLLSRHISIIVYIFN